MSHLKQWLTRNLLPQINTSGSVAAVQGTLVTVALLGAAAVGWAFTCSERERLNDDLTTRGRSSVQVLGQTLAEPVGKGDRKAVRRVLASMKGNSRLRGVWVNGASGERIAQVGDVPDKPPTEVRSVCHRAGFTHRIIIPAETDERVHEFRCSIEGPQRAFGTVTAHYTMPGSTTLLAEGMSYSIVPLILAAIPIMIGTYLVSRSLNPFQMLRERLCQFESEKQWRKLGLKHKGDAGTIARHWDTMVADLSERNEQLTEANRDLAASSKVLAFEKRRTDSIIEALSIGVVMLDDYGKVCVMNRAAETLLKTNRGEATGKGASALSSNTEMTDFLASLDEGTNRSSRMSTEINFETADGPDRVVKAVTMPMKVGSGKTSGTLLTISDVTQRKLEQQAREDFIASVSHELRAPLAAIKGYVEMFIDDEVDSPEMRREFFNTMNAECDRLARLVDNMIDISRIEVGNMVLNRSLMKTSKLLRDAIASVSAQAKNKNITLQSRIPEDLPDINADKEMFRVAVMNLLGNALKYTDNGGSVVLTGECAGKDLRINVADTGWGIPQEEQSRIFGKFYRGKHTGESKEVAGNGLGLALTKEIATLHGGEVGLESEVGKGSKFTISLPVS